MCFLCNANIALSILPHLFIHPIVSHQRCLSTASLLVACLKLLSVHARTFPSSRGLLVGLLISNYFYHISNHGEGLSVGLEYGCGAAS